MRRLGRFSIFGVVVCSTVFIYSFSTVVLGVEVSFQELGDLPGGNFGSYAHDISGDGSVVVGQSYSTLSPEPLPYYDARLQLGLGGEAFRWEDGMIAGLGDLPGEETRSYADGVSYDGSVIVGSGRTTSSTGMAAFCWQDWVMTNIGNDARAHGVSADGSIVVGHQYTTENPEAARWVNGSISFLGDLPGGDFRSIAFGVSGDGGVVVGEAHSANGQEAFRWEDGLMVGLGDLPGGDFYSTAEGVSADGLSVVGFSAIHSWDHEQPEGPDLRLHNTEAFRWRAGEGMVGLGDLAGGDFYSYALDASANGSIVVGYSAVDSWDDSFDLMGGELWLRWHEFEAFIWDEVHGMRSLQGLLETDYGLDLTGWELTRAMGISDDGLTIVGWGVNPDGFDESWIVTVPEPGTVLLLGLGALMLRANRLRRKARS